MTGARLRRPNELSLWGLSATERQFNPFLLNTSPTPKSLTSSRGPPAKI